jgi:hypothetical protein
MPEVFVYGSNLLRERLLARCPGISLAGRATLPGHQLTFDKVSVDGSGKCAFTAADGDVPGVLWNVPESELVNLDLAEGAGQGYERVPIDVIQEGGGSFQVLTYQATRMKRGLVPYDWYLALVLAGAMQQDLPPEHIARLREADWSVDPNPNRPKRLDAIEALEQAGMKRMLDELHDGGPRLVLGNAKEQ